VDLQFSISVDFCRFLSISVDFCRFLSLSFNSSLSLSLLSLSLLVYLDTCSSLLVFRKYLSLREKLGDRYCAQYHLFKSCEMGFLPFVQLLVGMDS
jgi:hypothetical protein